MVSNTLALAERDRPKASTYPKSTLACWAIRHDGLHGSIRVLYSLRAVRMCDDLRRRRAVRMLCAGSRSACLDRIGGNIPLRNTSGQLDVVVLSAGTIPLRDPPSGQAWRRKGRALSTRSRITRHVSVSLSEQSIFFFFSPPRLYRQGAGGSRSGRAVWRAVRGGGETIGVRLARSKGPPLDKAK